MHVVIASQLLGESDGGSQRSLRELAQVLMARGDRVTALASTLPPDVPGVRLGRVEDVPGALAAVAPDIVFTQLHWSLAFVEAARELRIPSVFFSRLGECLVGADLVVFNSRYCARRFPDLAGESLVVLPVVLAPVEDAVRREGRDVVLMANPIALKGGERLVAVARLVPEQRFLAVGGWWDPAEDGIDLSGQPNLEHWPAVADLSVLLARSVALLFPSVWPEPAGRVIVEACAAGVPVLASGVGGSPEMLGDAGTILPDDDRAWAQDVRRLAADDALWAQRSARAQQRASSFAAESAAAVDALLDRLDRLTARPARRPIALAVPPELAEHRYLTEHVFDLEAGDFSRTE